MLLSDFHYAKNYTFILIITFVLTLCSAALKKRHVKEVTGYEDFLWCVRSSPRSSMRLSMHASLWSRSITLDSVGMHGSVHVLLPARMSTGEKAVSGLRLLETPDMIGVTSRRSLQQRR